ncbi:MULTISPECIES: hypothetical protein [Mycolicibacterium]|jgi:peptidoglycan/LPS O-acetylase OafA/YrhL|uniref:Transmembrane protein n=2 Tax=Mycolicibacterium TaxID=1866885 RepID=A0A0J8UFP8_9MYCO|nr:MULTISPECIES: hypothetical protein [Mycolicibacterium]KMV19220.1 hypothetical protein ACT17_07190 [Mycolicibacterium conceptionense]MCV7334490.1 hypothetical protein [Mycolicibacterium senegalense]MCW1820323.1 hypothetical protein [Mycolicibacterium senegalense]MDR7288483.1 peptidoglycan/LPS O-acetylase OafA/YrhL [Mycolicibacterium senegalense]OBB09790.1 hypothetical protein A5718_10435 [Mycolicibacterium conceptionense]
MPSSPASRRTTIVFSCWLVGAVLLIAGGMLAVSASPPGVNTMLYRGIGVLVVLAGLGMAFLAGRSRTDDPRYRRAAMALSLAIVVLVVFTGLNILVLVALLPLLVGTGLNALPLRKGDDGE